MLWSPLRSVPIPIRNIMHQKSAVMWCSGLIPCKSLIQTMSGRWIIIKTYNDLLAAKKKMKHKTRVVAIVTNKTGDHCENTLNPWTTFILLEIPEIIRPAEKVNPKRNAVNISLRILDMSLNYARLRMKPMIKKRTPRPMVMYEDRSWLRFQVGLRYPSVRKGMVLFVAKVPPRIPARIMTMTATNERGFLLAASL